MSTVDNDYAVRVDDLFHIVGDQNYRDPFLTVQFMNRFNDLAASVRV